MGVRFGFGLVNMIGNSSCVLCLVIHRGWSLFGFTRQLTVMGSRKRVTIRVGVKMSVSVRVR